MDDDVDNNLEVNETESSSADSDRNKRDVQAPGRILKYVKFQLSVKALYQIYNFQPDYVSLKPSKYLQWWLATVVLTRKERK